MLTIEKLRKFGANVDEGLSRCMNNEAFYLRLVKMLYNDQNFEGLKQAIEANDLKRGFECAHALKGVLGNLSITPLFNIASEMTELLREQKQANYNELLAKLLAKKEEFVNLDND